MFLDKIDYEVYNEQYLTEAYAKGKLASDYISKIRNQCQLMTYIPGFDKAKITRLDGLIQTYEDKLELAKKELADYRSKSEDEKSKIERLNKIDTILSTSIKIAVIVLSIYISIAGAAKALPSLVTNAKKITKSKRIIAKLLNFTKIPAKIVEKADKISKMSKGLKIANAAKNSIGEIGKASDTVKLGGYEAEIVKCIREMEQLLVVLKNKRNMFERELEKKERGIR